MARRRFFGRLRRLSHFPRIPVSIQSRRCRRKGRQTSRICEDCAASRHDVTPGYGVQAHECHGLQTVFASLPSVIAVGGNVTCESFCDEHEEIPYRAVPGRAASYRAAGIASEIQRSVDLPPSRFSASRTGHPAGSPWQVPVPSAARVHGLPTPIHQRVPPSHKITERALDLVASSPPTDLAVFDKHRTRLDQLPHARGTVAPEFFPSGNGVAAGRISIPDAASE